MSKDVERITQINDQGEIIGGFVAVIRPKQKSAFQRHFTMNQDALRILAKGINRGAIQGLNADACRSGLRKLHSDRPSRYC